MSNIKRNIGYQTIYQILNTFLPLITSPYLARVLGAEKQGVFSFTQSIVNYFMLISMLGVINYGSRTIALCGDNRDKRSDCFWNIYALQICVTLISLTFYSIYISFFCAENIHIAFIQTIYLFGALLDINWFFFGIEKFKITVTRSIFIRLSSVLLIVLFVKSPEDLWVYTIIMAGSPFVSNAILFYFLPRDIEIKSVKEIQLKKIIKHLKPNIILFIPILAMSVYHIMDKTMIGLFSTYTQVGYYYNADKIINIPIGIINGIGIVMLPRMTTLIKQNEESESNNLFKLSFEIVFSISSAMAFGIACISKEFTPFFFGKGFEPCILLIIVLSPVLIIKGLSQTARMQFLIPRHLEKIFIESVLLGVVVNLIINIVLIKRIGSMGAVIGTLTAEFITCLWQYLKMHKYMNNINTLLKSLIYIVFGLMMFIVVRVTASFFNGGFTSLIVEIITGSLTYGILCIMYWKISKNKILSIMFPKCKY